MRGRNKIRKQVYLGLDDFKKKLYAWDYVELTVRMELSTPWISRIYWNPVDGAFVDSHPAHKSMGIGGHRSLRSFLDENNKYDISHLFRPQLDTYTPNMSIKKVSYTDYLNWCKSKNL